MINNISKSIPEKKYPKDPTDVRINMITELTGVGRILAQVKKKYNNQ